jgi:RNA polymerase sigma-70 factor (ECF subfamily)
VDAFLAASQGGDFAALLRMLDPEVVMRADAAGASMGAAALVRGAGPVAEVFSGRARAAQLATIDGEAGVVWSRGGTPMVVFDFTIDLSVGDEGRITAIDLLADPATLAEMTIEPA